jgi:hypothetical protein
MAIVLSDKLRRTLEELKEKDRVAELMLDPEATHARSMNHLSLRKDGSFAFTPRGKPLVYKDEGVWSKEGRQEARPGRVVRKVFVPDVNAMIKDAHVEKFVARLAGDFLDGDMELVSGDAIHHWYQADNNHSKCGRLNSSCMQSATRNRLAYYTRNPETVHLLILRDGNKIRARALVWDTDHGTTMDVIYGNDDARIKFLNYAREQGWNAYYECQNRTGNTYGLYAADGASLIGLQLKVPIADWSFCMVPSIDTFRYFLDDGHSANRGPSTYRWPDDCDNFADDEEDYYEDEANDFLDYEEEF